MKKQTYFDAVKAIEKQATRDKQQLAIQYAKANNPYKKGDIVTDHHQSIIIDTMVVSIGFVSIGFVSRLPAMAYSGPILKKDMTPRADKKHGAVYQVNIKT